MAALPDSVPTKSLWSCRIEGQRSKQAPDVEGYHAATRGCVVLVQPLKFNILNESWPFAEPQEGRVKREPDEEGLNMTFPEISSDGESKDGN